MTRNLAMNLLFLACLGIVSWYLQLGMGMPEPVEFGENGLSSWLMQGLMRSPVRLEEEWHFFMQTMPKI
jgi:hypothetical protein